MQRLLNVKEDGKYSEHSDLED